MDMDETLVLSENMQQTLNFCTGWNYSDIYIYNSTNATPDGYLNVTMELPVKYAQPLYGYLVPFLLIITIIANTLIVVVLSKRHMRTPTNVVLMAMALCDMLTLLFPAPWLFYMYTLGNHYKPLSPTGMCYAYKVMNEVQKLFSATTTTTPTCLYPSSVHSSYTYNVHTYTASMYVQRTSHV